MRSGAIPLRSRRCKGFQPQASNQPDSLATASDRELEKLVYACYASFSAPLLLAEGQFLFPAGSVIACKLHSTQTFERGAAGVAASMLAVTVLE